MSQPTLFRGLYPSIRQVKAQLPEKPFTERELAQASEIRKRAYGAVCPHEPECRNWQACEKNIARSVRRRG